MKLINITRENWLEIVILTTNQDGKATISEEFVASNAVSIVQSVFEEGWIIKGIQVDDALVGFTMYGFPTEHNHYDICRFMIDRNYQGKGYGGQALQLIINELKTNDDCQNIYLSTEPDNERAIKLYESFGFQQTGKVIEGEMEYCLSFEK